MFVLIFLLTAIILSAAFHSYKKTHGRSISPLQSEKGGVSVFTQMLQYLYLIVLFCQIGYFFELLIGKKSIFYFLDWVNTAYYFEGIGGFWIIVFYLGMGLAAATTVFVFFNLPGSSRAMARLLLVPVLSLAVQSAVEDVPFILSLNEDVLIRISSVVIGSLFVWIKLLKTEIQPEAESRGSRLYRNPGIMFFILIFCIGIPLLTAGWFGVSIFEYFFETTGGFNIDFIILTVPFFVAVADNTYVVQRSFSGFIERGAEF